MRVGVAVPGVSKVGLGRTVAAEPGENMKAKTTNKPGIRTRKTVKIYFMTGTEIRTTQFYPGIAFCARKWL
jgi:hypothetical protein